MWSFCVQELNCRVKRYNGPKLSVLYYPTWQGWGDNQANDVKTIFYVEKYSPYINICFFLTFGFSSDWTLTPESVVCDLLPGPVTLVIERPQFLPLHVNPGCEWIGVRVPNSLISQTLAQQEPLCLTSANLSGASSAITANDFAELHPLLDAVVDLGPITDSHMSR